MTLRLVERKERLVHCLHPGFRLPDLNLRIDLMNLIFPDQVPVCRVRDHNLKGQCPASAVHCRNQGLAHYPFQDETELCPHLRLLMSGENVHDSVDCLHARVRVKSSKRSSGPFRPRSKRASMVSRSRISPMSTTSGSCLKLDRSAALIPSCPG